MEIYLPDFGYNFAVARITEALQTDHPDPEERRDRTHVAMRLNGIDTGELTLANGRINPESGELLEALLALEPSPATGEIDENDVKLMLGEIGNIWPASIREEAA